MGRRNTTSFLFVWFVVSVLCVVLFASSSYYVSALASETRAALTHHNDKGHRLEVEARALLAFRSKITKDPDGLFTNWNLNNTHNLCSSNNHHSTTSWYGVNCSSHPPFRVISLSLPGLGLTGTMSASICNLTSLRNLVLYANNLMGEIPPCLGTCPSLVELDLGWNNLSGYIPLSLANLSSLQELDLSDNNLVGELPQAWSKCSSLRALVLKNNDLSGSIPSSLGNLSHLQSLYLGHASHDDETDKLSGLIPPELGKLRALGGLYIHGDNIVGSLPSEFGNLTMLRWLEVNARNLNVNLQLLPKLTTRLQELSLTVSNFSSKIPVEIRSLKSLTTLLLSGRVTRAGGIPQELCKLPLLDDLTLDHTQLGGQIPDCIGNMTQLERLHLPGNRLEGELAAGIFSNLSSLYTLDLSSNAFSGNVPQLCKLNRLIDLMLYNNSLGWPSQVELPSSLEMLQAHSNNFSGPLPQALGNCTSLLVLDMRNNRVSGQLPDYLAKMQLLYMLQLGDNNLEGFIPNWISNLTYLHILDLSNNKFKGNIPHTLLSIRGFLVDDISDRQKVYVDIMEREKGLVLFREYMPLANRLIDLSANKLTGQIPSCIGILNGLRLLNLSHNELQGKIPASISNMSNLEELDLNSNQLTGAIPSELLHLTFLSSFNISNNLLCGRIPIGEQFNTFDETCFQGNKCLCGYSPQHQCILPEHKENTAQEQVKETWFDKLLDKVSILAVGLGFGLAFGGTWALYFLWEPFQKFFGFLGI